MSLYSILKPDFAPGILCLYWLKLHEYRTVRYAFVLTYTLSSPRGKLVDIIVIDYRDIIDKYRQCFDINITSVKIYSPSVIWQSKMDTVKNL